MSPAPLQSFLRFTVGFMLFISLSFGITFAVNKYTASQEKDHQTAAALQAMLKQK